MAPTIRHGDRVVLTPVAGRIRRGEIVLARHRGRPLLHRVLSVVEDTLITAGDACGAEDEPLANSSVLAIAVAAERSECRIALRPTLRFGVLAFFRYIWYRGRASVSRAWRRQAVSGNRRWLNR